MSDADLPATDDTAPTAGSWARVLAVVAIVVVLVGMVAAGLVVGTSGADSDHANGASTGGPVTVRLADLQPETASLYRYAASHSSHFAELPCFCGCDTMLGPRSLADCFVTPTGAWDAHASGCGVCTAEALVARDALDRGTPVAAVRASLVAQYGQPSTSPNSSAGSLT